MKPGTKPYQFKLIRTQICGHEYTIPSFTVFAHIYATQQGFWRARMMTDPNVTYAKLKKERHLAVATMPGAKKQPRIYHIRAWKHPENFLDTIAHEVTHIILHYQQYLTNQSPNNISEICCYLHGDLTETIYKQIQTHT